MKGVCGCNPAAGVAGIYAPGVGAVRLPGVGALIAAGVAGAKCTPGVGALKYGVAALSYGVGAKFALGVCG